MYQNLRKKRRGKYIYLVLYIFHYNPEKRKVRPWNRRYPKAGKSLKLELKTEQDVPFSYRCSF